MQLSVRESEEIYTKLDNLKWVGLTPEQRQMMLKAIEPFYVPVTFEDMKNPGNPITITMYPGDKKRRATIR